MTTTGDADDDRNPWAELRAIDAQFYARLEPKFGRCPACDLTPTAVYIWLSISWSTCHACRLRWPSPTALHLDPSVLRDGDEGVVLTEEDCRALLDLREEIVLWDLVDFNHFRSLPRRDASGSK